MIFRNIKFYTISNFFRFWLWFYNLHLKCPLKKVKKNVFMLPDSELSIIKCGSTKSQSPIVPPSLLNGVLTCQPYQGISLNHVYFQLANAFFLLSHLAPNGVHGVLYLRCTLLVGCAFLTLWGWTIACWLEAVLWNALFVFINFIHVCMLLYRLRPVRFSKEIEEVITFLS